MQKNHTWDPEESKQSTNTEKKTNKSSYLIYREQIENTPFTITGTEENGYFIVLGAYRISETYETIQEAIESLDTKKWDIIFTLIQSIIHFMEEEKKKMTIN